MLYLRAHEVPIALAKFVKSSLIYVYRYIGTSHTDSLMTRIRLNTPNQGEELVLNNTLFILMGTLITNFVTTTSKVKTEAQFIFND